MSLGDNTNIRAHFTELLSNTHTPIPADNGKGRSINGLAWSPGLGNVTFDVYFGTSEAAVAAAGTSDAEFQGNQAGLTFALPLQPGGGERFWRIDPRGLQTLLTGPVRSFNLRRQNQVV